MSRFPSILASIREANAQSDPRVELANLPKFKVIGDVYVLFTIFFTTFSLTHCLVHMQIDRRGNIILRKSDLRSDATPHPLIAIIDSRPVSTCGSSKFEYLCVFQNTFINICKLGTIEATVASNFDTLKRDCTHIATLGQSIDEMKRVHADDVGADSTVAEWPVDFLVAEARDVDDESGSNKMVLVAWTPVWLPAEYVFKHYSKHIERFKLEQSKVARATRAARRQQHKGICNLMILLISNPTFDL